MCGEAVEEFFVGAFEGDFGVDAEFAGEVGHDEEEVSDLGLEFGRGFLAFAVLGEFLPDFGEFFVDLFGNADGAGPVEADFAGFLLKLGGSEEGGEAFANSVEVGSFLVALFGALDVLPLGKDALGGPDGRVAIDVGMAADEFVADPSGDLVEVEAVVFLERVRRGRPLGEGGRRVPPGGFPRSPEPGSPRRFRRFPR